MSSIVMQGSIYTSITAAALAWAETALPDPTVIEAHEEPQAAAEELVRFWTTEAERIGEGITPEGVDASEWRTAIVAALVSRIVRAREGATADDPDARRYRVTFDRPRGADLASTLVLLEREPMTAAAVRVVAAQHHVHARLRHVETGEDVGVLRPDGSLVGGAAVLALDIRELPVVDLDALPEQTDLEWALMCEAGDYLARYEDDGLDDVTDPGSRCGRDDMQLDAIRGVLDARGLRLVADDIGLVAVKAKVQP